MFQVETFGCLIFGSVFEKYSDPVEWISTLKKLKYRTAYFTVVVGADETQIKTFQKAAFENDIIISEVGAWSNTISIDDGERKEAIEK